MDFEALLSIPDFIDLTLTNPFALSPDDRYELERHGGLTIPPPALRHLILEAFVEFVYPQLPVVDFPAIVASVHGHAGSAPVSLLLFQAVMFAGVSNVPLDHLQQHGYTSHLAARSDFFRRVESCFEATTSSSPSESVVLIQSLLLMTLWYDPASGTKDSHHWMGIASVLSEQLGMHHTASQYYPQDPATVRLWRRIAWSMYARDRMILLSARRPASIRTADFTLAPLDISDFEIEPTEELRGSSCLLLGCQMSRNGSQLRDMAELCVEQIHAARFVDDVFAVQAQLKGMESPATFAPALLACDSKLRAWRARTLAPSVAIPDRGQRGCGAAPDSLMVQRAILCLTYDTIISALHRPVVLQGTHHNDPRLGQRLLKGSEVVLNDATRGITDMADYLYRHTLALFLPATVVTSLLSALIVHIASSKAVDMDAKRRSLRDFETCLRLLSQLQTRYANADDVYRFLESTVIAVRAEAEGETWEMVEMSRILEQVKCPDSLAFSQDVQQPELPIVDAQDPWVMDMPTSLDLDQNIGAMGMFHDVPTDNFNFEPEHRFSASDTSRPDSLSFQFPDMATDHDFFSSNVDRDLSLSSWNI